MSSSPETSLRTDAAGRVRFSDWLGEYEVSAGGAGGAGADRMRIDRAGAAERDGRLNA